MALRPSPVQRLGRAVVLAAASVPLLGCPTPSPPLAVTPTIEAPSPETPPPGALVVGPTATRGASAAGPAPPQTARAATHNLGPPPLRVGTQTEALALEQVTLPAFINEIFAKTLKLNVQIDQPVMSRTDLVTLRTGRPLSADELFTMAEKILQGYGIALNWDGSVLHVVTDEALMAQMPALIHGRALPEMPTVLRPIFQIVDLHQVSAADMMLWLSNAYGTKIKIFASPKTNAIMIFGLPENVRAAVEAVQVLDQPRLAGRQSLRLSPVYWNARGLAEKLIELLRAEGYDASASSVAVSGQGSAIVIVPVEANNSLIAFAADPKILAHIGQWFSDLDKPGQVDPTHNIFIYLVQNTTAASLGRTVQSVLGGAAPAISAPAEAQLELAGRTQLPQAFGQGEQTFAQPGQPFGQAGGASVQAGAAFGQGSAPRLPPQPSPPEEGLAGAPPPSPRAVGPRLVIDAARNALVLVGTAQDYERIRPLLQALDKAPRETLIEVTVIELDLTDETNLGVEFTVLSRLNQSLSARYGTGTNVFPPSSSSSSSGQTSSGLGLATSGFNYVIFNNAADVRFVLNAFAANDKNSVLSTPRVLAESGATANIDVGQQVPIVTGQTTTNVVQNAGTSGILQSIEYINTGVLLSVQPVVHSGNRIDLRLTQTVSQPLPNTTQGISSPIIQNRTITTQLALDDGQTVVIGGLITDNRTNDDTGIPYLKDIPVLGTLFRNQQVSHAKNELLVFITPYVISSDADAAAVTQQFQEQMKSWPLPSTQLHW
jgi:general secretion pathway protein D